jgi:hypothetical protein
MPTLTVLPESSFTLTVTGDTAGEGSVTLEPTPQAAMTLHVNPLGPDIDLTPLLGALESISEALPVDLAPVLAAVAPLATSEHLANATDTVLARLDDMPAPDVAAAVAPLATTEQLAASEARTLGAISAIPAPDVTATLESFDVAKKSDVIAAETGLKSWITSAVEFIDGRISAAKDSLASLITPLAKKTDVDSGLAALLAALPPPVAKGQVVEFSVGADGQPPPGYALVNGTLPLPSLGGLLTFLGPRMDTVSTGSSRPVQQGNGDVFYSNGGSLLAWNPTVGGKGAGAGRSIPSIPGYLPSSYELTFLPSGRLLAAGFVSNNSAQTNCWALNFETATWNSVAPLPTVPRVYNALTTLPNGRVACIGGSINTSVTAANMSDRLDIYDEPTNTWTAGPVAPVRGAGGSVLMPDGRVLWVPARISDGTTVTIAPGRAFIYDPIANSWAETDPLPAGTLLRNSSVLVQDDAGALLVDVDGPQSACRYTAGNAPGARWSPVRLDCYTPEAGTYDGGFGLKMANGQIFLPRPSTYPQIIAVQFNPGNQIVHARKL